MLQAIRRRLNATSLLAVLALVFAMSGGAYAASRYLITSTKQIKPSVLKQLQGKPGANGAQGSAGPTGQQGVAGARGETGPQGPQGPQGLEGKTGPQGPEGKAGFAKTLPSGETESGEWSLSGYVTGEAEPVTTSVSFAFALGEAPAVKYVKEGESPPSGCSGSAADPGAAPGVLCVFVVEESANLINPAFVGAANVPLIVTWRKAITGANEASPFGFGLKALSKEAGPVVMDGTWAVTAE
ncbi:MAG TPA: hypothetical protein VGL57_05090 [Solirubrobacteraceae bacterium]